MAVNDYVAVSDVTNLLPNLDLFSPGANGVAVSTILTGLITSASRAIDTWTGRKPGAYKVDGDVVRYFDGPNNELYSQVYGFQSQRLTSGYTGATSLWIGELAAAPTEVAMSLTGTLSYTALASTDYHLHPYNAPDEGLPYQRLDLDILNGNYRVWYPYRKGIRVTGKFGYSTAVPGDIKQVVIILVARWFKRAEAGWQDKVSLLDEKTALTYLNQQDSDVAQAIAHYRRVAV